MLKHIDRLKPISGKPDDLFICAAGPESTCLDSMLSVYDLQKVKAYSANLAIRINYGRYEEADRLNLPPSKRPSLEQSYNFDTLSRLMNWLFTSRKVRKLSFSRSKSHDNYHNLEERLKKNSLLDSLVNVTIDATSVLDQDLFTILSLVDKPSANVRILYSIPPKGKLPLGKGPVFTSVLPGFQGDLNNDGTYNHVAAILCGYEPDKAMFLDDMLRSRYTYFIFPKPSFHRGWDSMSKRLHKKSIIGLHKNHLQDDSRVLEASGLDPLSVKSVLDNIYSSYPINHEDRSLRHYMQVALAGCTKLQTVGAYLFVRDKVKEKEGFAYSHVGVYYGVPDLPPVMIDHGELVEFMLPKKSL